VLFTKSIICRCIHRAGRHQCNKHHHHTYTHGRHHPPTHSDYNSQVTDGDHSSAHNTHQDVKHHHSTHNTNKHHYTHNNNITSKKVVSDRPVDFATNHHKTIAYDQTQHIHSNTTNTHHIYTLKKTIHHHPVNSTTITIKRNKTIW
jgi:hypothetical protein